MASHNFPVRARDWKKLEISNKSINLKNFLVEGNTKKIRLAYKSKHDVNRTNHANLLMITDTEKWNYLDAKSKL